MKRSKSLSLLLSLLLVFAMIATSAVTASANDAEVKSSSPVLKNSTYTQTDPNEVEFTLQYSSSAWEQKVGTVYKLYTSADMTEEAGTATGIVSETNAEKYGSIKFVLNKAPERDTAYYVTATEPDRAESDYRIVSFAVCNVVDALSFSYGEYADVEYVEFYQDKLTYDVVLPVTTAKDAPVSLKLELLDGETAVYEGGDKLTDGKATLTASVDSTTHNRKYTYTVNFSVLELEGSGTEEDPWKLYTAEDLMNLALCHNSGAAAPMDKEDVGYGNHLGYYFELMNDVDLLGYDWEPIGHSGSSYFAGNFDGNGHTLYNMKSDGLYNRAEGVDYAHYNAVGVFGWAAFGAIKELIVENAEFTAIGDNEQGYAGGLMGVAFGCTVTDCAVYNSRITSGRMPFVNTNAAGGVAGFGTGASFERCATVGNTVTSASYGGGFIGALDGDDCYFTDCYVAKSKIIANSPSAQLPAEVGGFIGESQFGLVACKNCFVYDCIVEKAPECKCYVHSGIFTGLRAYNDYDFVNCYFYSKGLDDAKPSFTIAKSGGFWNINPIGTGNIATDIPDTETLTINDVIWRMDNDKAIWQFSVDNGAKWYDTKVNVAVRKSVDEFNGGNVTDLLNGDREAVYKNSDIHDFPTLKSVREFSTSLNSSGIVSVEKIGAENNTDIYEITYIPTGDVVLHSFTFTVTNGENGANGITPSVRINETSNEWEVSYDNGETWTSLGVKATGDKGADGQNGTDGQNGQNGSDGKDGQDGTAGGGGLAVAAIILSCVAIAGQVAVVGYAVVKKGKKTDGTDSDT